MSVHELVRSDDLESPEPALPVIMAVPREGVAWRRLGYAGVMFGVLSGTALGVYGTMQFAGAEPKRPQTPPVTGGTDEELLRRSAAAEQKRRCWHNAQSAWKAAQSAQFPGEVPGFMSQMEQSLNDGGLTRAEIGAEDESVVSVWHSAAEGFWKHAQHSLVGSDMEKAFAQMDNALEQAGCTREDIGVTSAEMRECRLRLAKGEWERAVYFSGIQVFSFCSGALGDMERALKNADASPQDIGVSTAEVDALKEMIAKARDGAAQ